MRMSSIIRWWSHVDLGGPALRLPNSKTGAEVVHVGQPVVDLVQSGQRTEGKPWPIIGTLEGKPLSALEPFWQRVRARTGVKDVRMALLMPLRGPDPARAGRGSGRNWHRR
jgi:hypothetical protein